MVTHKDHQETISKSIELATTWQDKANVLLSPSERGFHDKMQKMLSHPMEKIFLIELMDQSFRSHNPTRVKNQIEHIFSKYNMSSFFTAPERFLIFLFRIFGSIYPRLSVPLFVNNIRRQTKSIILSGESKPFKKHLLRRKTENIRVNVNLIGEAILGEKEAAKKMEEYLNALADPQIDYLSVKISTLFSQINPLAHDQTVEVLVQRLTRLYQQAKKYPCIEFVGNGASQIKTSKPKEGFNGLSDLGKGEPCYKFINLDMEEYRDLALTVHAFQKTLESPDLQDLKAGIVLQAYLPDAHIWQKELTEWAKERVRKGGSPIKIRLVKGANMEMEETESSLKGWPLTTYTKKIDADSNYKAMAEYALEPENIRAAHLGIGSHNLFDVAYCYTLAQQNKVLEYLSLEMLEGMSEASRMAISQVSQSPIVYAPVCTKAQFTNAIAYLVRRLDENTNKNNFIRHSFNLTTQSEDWELLKRDFLASFENKKKLFVGHHRQQNRLTENWDNYEENLSRMDPFKNEPDTDFILPPNKEWAAQICKKWMRKKEDPVPTLPIVVGGQNLTGEGREVLERIDKSQVVSRPHGEEKVVCVRYTKSQPQDLLKAAEVAQADPDGWRKLTVSDRQKILGRVANKVRAKRGDLIGVAAAEVGKVFTETDVEVSEAVDFLELGRHSLGYFEKIENIKFKGKGVGLVVPPWNFPIAIPLGGITTALAAGNTVILKPASNAVFCGYQVCQCFWEAGVSQNTLQFVPCPGSLAQEHLIKNKNINFVILTGGEDTAEQMLDSRPELFLTAETGGKNATIVTAMADGEQAIRNVVLSAFGNSGQKCSATSLLILEREVYEDPKFKASLVDAAESLKVGSVWDFESRLGTLANPIGGDLKKAMETLGDGETWALKPKFVNDNPYMLSPGIKWGVKEGSFCHTTELFGPILSVMKADNLDHAIRLVNQTGYGLTSGIESLDEREVHEWRQKIRAGNLYINRGTTGAIVLRQPFGGLGKSAVGSGRKVGSYNYITQFMNIEDRPNTDGSKIVNPPIKPATAMASSPEKSQKDLMLKYITTWKESYPHFKEDFHKLESALESYYYHYVKEFSQEHDYFHLRGEDNIFRYMKLKSIALRVSQEDTLFEALSRILACKMIGISLQISIAKPSSTQLLNFFFKEVRKLLENQHILAEESEIHFARRFPSVDRIIYSKESNVSKFIFSEAARYHKFIVRAKPLMEGRLECLHYFDEQAISHSYHRYGNLGNRSKP